MAKLQAESLNEFGIEITARGEREVDKKKNLLGNERTYLLSCKDFSEINIVLSGKSEAISFRTHQSRFGAALAQIPFRRYVGNRIRNLTVDTVLLPPTSARFSPPDLYFPFHFTPHFTSHFTSLLTSLHFSLHFTSLLTSHLTSLHSSLHFTSLHSSLHFSLHFTPHFTSHFTLHFTSHSSPLKERCVDSSMEGRDQEFFEEEEWEDNDDLEETQTERDINATVILSLNENTSKKRKRVSVPSAELETIREEKRQQLKNAVTRSKDILLSCYDDDLLVFCLSILPEDLLNSSPTIAFLTKFQQWFQSFFEVIPNKDMTTEEGRDGSLSHDLIHVMTKSAGSSHQLCQVALAFLTTMTLTARYAVTIDLKSSQHNPRGDIIPYAWIEVWIPSIRGGGKWFCVDFMKNLITLNKSVIETYCRPRKSSLCYAISIERTGKIEDITFCYATNPVRTRAKRLSRADDQKWWEDLLTRLSSSGSRQFSIDETTESHESEALKVLPGSLSGFQNHPYYALAGPEHLGKKQILRPEAKPVALFTGLPVYLRSDVCELKTALQWKKCNRILLPDEVPIRCQGSSPELSHHSSSSSSSSVTKELFAEYQTTERPTLEVLIDESGRKQIPMNKHGNIEIWDGKQEHVPRGCVYLPSSHAVEAAQQLGIQHVPAIIGFKSIGVMKYCPVIQGLVVLEEDYDLMVEATMAMENQAAEKEKEKKYSKIVKKWVHLTRLVLSRVKLFEEYGH
jgi:hypothetical protein